MDINNLTQLLRAFRDGKLSEEEALQELRDLPFQDLGFAKVDHHRGLRTGFPEVVFGQSKTPEQILAIATSIVERDANLLVTRIDSIVGDLLKQNFPDGNYDETSRLFVREASPQPRLGRVGVVTAGTTDIPVAEEAAQTLHLFGCDVDRIFDVGVAGVHRLEANRQRLDDVDVIVVVAGMEGALASVIAGFAARPVIAVPTSIGYGASFGGLAALLGMMTSCAAGVTVVNIDNGFGAGCAAAMIVRRIYQPASDHSEKP